jgi:hypothetical protein
MPTTGHHGRLVGERSTTAVNNRIPSSPYDNPFIDNGEYEAIIDRVSAGVGGEEKRPFIRIALRLVDINLYFVTDLCLTGESAASSEHHLKCVCSIVGMEDAGSHELLDALAGRRLRVKITQIIRQDAGGGDDYSDVERFMATKQKPDPSQNTPQDGGDLDRSAGRYVGVHRNAEAGDARRQRKPAAADYGPMAGRPRALLACTFGALPLWGKDRA